MIHINHYLSNVAYNHETQAESYQENYTVSHVCTHYVYVYVCYASLLERKCASSSGKICDICADQ